MAFATATCLAPFFPPPPPSSSSSSSFPSLRSLCFFTSGTTPRSNQRFSFPFANEKFATLPRSSPNRLTTRFSEYKFPDPIPEFADAETEKFRNHLLQKLSKPSKKDTYGESVEEVVGVCTEIFSTFLHSEYGGPGTLLVIPFIDMADAVSERGLPGGPQAARAAVKWAQSNVDKDWREWNGGDSN
ncbi:hypothetical protein HN51_013635 [Arachis hypogaea]|uniref:protein PLASTID REDOX INSENSITIVE 2 n=1 Tax=Arachis ipaensis TaxID=130454 RepID=UPI0007AFBE81|nr:protein PLASTID REDOX INSENSITIVE 2 [Arachis ipaensis]XP_025638894.1 protein PLASTID REDOX INSENSITIVE 2, chloroplastic [Arachis hypogaea]XP_025638895.1 protein PLASTID REDOX INSENSITIVE 2, chloroplastic [Arachis hypogaea]QHO59402.1 uncharacterized protein DS421_3g98810 [Arachis hypogaea]